MVHIILLQILQNVIMKKKPHKLQKIKYEKFRIWISKYYY